MDKYNLLLAALPREAYDKIEPVLETLSLPRKKLLHSPGNTIKDIYFPLDCLISVTVTTRDGKVAEAGAIGNRDMVGINAFMGGRETTQTDYIVQLPGDAVRIDAGTLKDEFDRSKALRDVMLRYTQAYIAQLSQNAACNRLHNIRQRCARWLLETSARVDSDDIMLTQEFLAEMLGVRRASVNEISRELESAGLINQSRGRTQIVDRRGLEEHSCECYGVLREEYDRLLKDYLQGK